MDKKLTDNEIIKALENVAEWFTEHGKNTNTAVIGISKQAIDLINHQRAEIERLNKEVETFADIGKMYSEIKAEAVKEFAERLKEKSGKVEMVCSGALVQRDYTISEKTLDNLLKELVGDDDG